MRQSNYYKAQVSPRASVGSVIQPDLWQRRRKNRRRRRGFLLDRGAQRNWQTAATIEMEKEHIHPLIESLAAQASATVARDNPGEAGMDSGRQRANARKDPPEQED